MRAKPGLGSFRGVFNLIIMKKPLKQSNLYILTFCLACCSLLYELLIAEAIASLATNMVVWYSLTIGLYLVSLGIGAMQSKRFFLKGIQGAYGLFTVEIGLSFLGAISLIALYLGHMLMSYFWVRGLYSLSLWIFYLVAFLLVIAIGFLSGLELPLIITMAKEIFPQKDMTNRILASDYFGSLIAGLIFPLYLIPRWELINISFFIAGINLIIALYLFVVDYRRFCKNEEERTSRISSFALPMAFIIGFSFCSIHVEAINQYFLKKYYYYNIVTKDFGSLFKGMKNFPPIQREISSYQRIDLVRLPHTADYLLSQDVMSVYKKEPNDFNKKFNDYALFLNGAFQFYAMTEEYYHEYFAHIPIIINGKIPRKVLILGAGDGLLARELIKYDAIEEIVMVEIDEKMVKMAKTNPILSAINQNSLSDKRIMVHIGDAYSFVRDCRKRFDAVYLDFPEPADYNISKIYSTEFYQAVYNLLNTDGYIVFDAPEVQTIKIEESAGLSDEALVYLKTLYKAGFQSLISYEIELEKDNEKAQRIIANAIGTATELRVKEKDVNQERSLLIKGQKNIVNKILSDFIDNNKQRFIFAQKHSRLNDLSYVDFGEDFNILNKERYALAIDYYSQRDGLIFSEKKANSILRPTLPNPRFWWRLKFPY